ncbi:MAG: hypothetical protein IKA71_05165 [Lentisphaeria bacterium]|nr:hypothetical protein [Lentisphaeria bacterium]
MYKYTVLTYIFNGYENVREIGECDPNAEYLLITDDPELKSETWKVIYDHELDGLSPFDKCYRVRFSLFNYASTDICVYIDGSIHIQKSFSHLIDDFIAGNYEAGVMVHAQRDTFPEEYQVWMQFRNYPEKQAEKFFKLLQHSNYDLNFRGMFAGGFRIWRRTKLCADIDRMTMAFLTMLGEENQIERLDQTVFSYVLNTFFRDINILPLSFQVILSDYMQWCHHGTRIPHSEFGFNTAHADVQYVFNKRVQCHYLLPPGVAQPPRKKQVTYSFR